MKKNILQLSIVFIAVLVFSTMTMAGGKKHYHHSWWNPLSGLWSAINQLQDQISNMDKKVDAKLAKLSKQSGGTDPGSYSTIDPGTGPLVCPGCWFPAGSPPPEIMARMKGAYLSSADMGGIILSNADLSEADLRGIQLTEGDLSGANLYKADLSPKPYGKDGNLVYKANLANTNLSNADLTEADLTDVQGLKSVIWKNTTCPDGTNSDNNGGTCENNL